MCSADINFAVDSHDAHRFLTSHPYFCAGARPVEPETSIWFACKRTTVWIPSSINCVCGNLLALPFRCTLYSSRTSLLTLILLTPAAMHRCVILSANPLVPCRTMRTRPAACFRMASNLRDNVSKETVLTRDVPNLTWDSQAAVLLDRTLHVHCQLQEQGNRHQSR